LAPLDLKALRATLVPWVLGAQTVLKASQASRVPSAPVVCRALQEPQVCQGKKANLVPPANVGVPVALEETDWRALLVIRVLLVL